jgi:hypothetical protein
VTRAYNSRASASLLSWALGVVMAGLHRWRVPLSTRALERAFVIIALVSVFQVTWQNVATVQWYGYLQVFSAELRTHRGLVPFEDSVLSRQPPGIQVVGNLSWSWTGPPLSILLAPGGRVTAIIDVARDTEKHFLDPRDPRTFPDLKRYGIEYSSYVEALALR